MKLRGRNAELQSEAASVAERVSKPEAITEVAALQSQLVGLQSIIDDESTPLSSEPGASCEE